MTTRTSRPSEAALCGKCLSGLNLANFLRRPEFEPGVGTAWFSKPISLRVRTWCRYSLALKPISLEQTVRMTHEGFTSLVSGACARRLSGLNHAIFLRGPEFDSGVNDANFCARCGPDGVFLWVKDLYVYPPSHIRHIPPGLQMRLP